MRRRVAFLISVLLAAVLAVAGCTGTSDQSGGDGAKAAEDFDNKGGAAKGGGGKGQGDLSGGKKTKPVKAVPTALIRTADLTISTKTPQGLAASARTAAENAGGYVGNERSTPDRTVLTLRVPAAEYEDFLDEVSHLEGGKLTDKDERVKDVTDQVVDVESRLKSQRASVERIRKLMDEATKLSDVVALEGELSTRQADLEALQTQQKSLKDRTTFGTITLTLTKQDAPVEKEDDETTIAAALSGGWDAFVDTLRWIGIVLAAVLPFAAVLAVLILGVRLLLPRLPRRAPAPASSEED
ncbi:DUF4349 domain-containing protein [Streptomyces sp. A7024]|uniref:DUF4349 domain-containing protein n=1 Tax=Streptomyces coryli TaxID=1128680 RepID=A0A6G4U7B9_9ACTN|nr:DUF4349 domain-containing protein [Streptomyces coryli]NGN67892.1 DUF4349 domain-containing protein [Streptomyces coryli]